MYDVIIIGGGPAGMAVALNTLRNGRTCLLLEKENFGGQMATSPKLENIPGIKAIAGTEYADQMFDQITEMGAEFELEEVESITKDDEKFIVKTNYNTYESWVVVLANGCHHRKMNLPHEDDLIGKGISYCAVCDGAFYKGQTVNIIGDANTALQYALLRKRGALRTAATPGSGRARRPRREPGDRRRAAIGRAYAARADRSS